MTTFDFNPPRTQSSDESNAQRLSYMSNISSYSGVVSDAVPIAFLDKTNVNLVPASQDDFHTPLSSPTHENKFLEDHHSEVEQDQKHQETPLHLPFLKLQKREDLHTNKSLLPHSTEATNHIEEDVPLNSPPKDITTVSNCDSSLDSDDDNVVESRFASVPADAKALQFGEQHRPSPEPQNIAIKHTKYNAVADHIIPEQNNPPIQSFNGSISITSNERLNSMTSYSTDNPIGMQPLHTNNIISDTNYPGAFPQNTGPTKEPTPKPRKAPAKQYPPGYMGPNATGNAKPRSRPVSQTLDTSHQNNVPTKHVTSMPSTSSPSYYSTSNLYFGTGAYNNSFRAGETFTSSKDVSTRRKSFINAVDGTLPDPEKKHTRNSSIHNSMASPITTTNVLLPPSDDLDIPPRSPKRPSPAEFSGGELSDDSQSKPRDIDELYFDNSEATNNQLLFNDDRLPLNSEQLKKEHVLPSNDQKPSLFPGSQDFDEVSFTSLDNKTLLNTLRNSDLRSINHEQKRLSHLTPSEDTASLRHPNSEVSASSTKNLNYDLRPPSDNLMVQQDLDLTDDEQITSLINEMKLRSASNNPYSPTSKLNRKSLGFNAHSSVLSNLTSREGSPRSDKPQKSHNMPFHSNFDDSVPSVREKVSLDINRPVDAKTIENNKVISNSIDSSLPSPSSRLDNQISSGFLFPKTDSTDSNPLRSIPKNSLNYHHQRYKSDAFDDEDASIPDFKYSRKSSRLSIAQSSRKPSDQERRKSSLVSGASTVRNSSIQSEKPLIVKKRSGSSVTGQSRTNNESRAASNLTRPLPTPPDSAGTNGMIASTIASVGAVGSAIGAGVNAMVSRNISDSTAKTVTPEEDIGTKKEPVSKTVSETQPKPQQDLANTSENWVDETSATNVSQQQKRPEDDRHHRHGHRHHLDKSKSKSKHKSKSSKNGSKVKPLDYQAIARMLEATEGTVIGQEFTDLAMPMDQKRLLERMVDALSRLTADMIADPNRYDEGIRRLNTALRALEGFP